MTKQVFGKVNVIYVKTFMPEKTDKQDVVQIAIEPESSPAGLIPDNGNRPMHLGNSHTIKIEADGLLIRMSKEIKPVLLKMLMDTLKESLC